MIGTFLSGMAAMALLAAGAVLLAIKVFRRGAQDFDCPGFYSHVVEGDPGRLIRDIQRDARTPAQCRRDDPLACSLAETVGAGIRGNVLLLSGGGQWGAFGAGLFDALSEDSEGYLALPAIKVITGISTGALQTMLLMVALDGGQAEELRRLAIRQLLWGYSPEKESDVVRNSGLGGVPFFGSAAGTDPLRARIKTALRPVSPEYRQGDDRLIAAIAASGIAGYVGFVEAESGLFRYADMRKLAASAENPEAAAEALAAATMASSAMPVFHQQLRIRSDTGARLALYDGGVRRSVFFDRAMEVIDEAVRDELATRATDKSAGAADYADLAPCVFVVRNGPTVRTPDESTNGDAGALPNGQRGYDLLVNESELGAIAALRLGNPYGKIFVTTADQYDTFPCTEGENFKDKEMFKPAFMTALRQLGRWKARRPEGAFWELGALDRR